VTVEFPDGITEEMTASEALAFTLRFLDTDPDDTTLCRAALTICEPLVDWHWEPLMDQLVELLGQRADLRKMVSCCDFDNSVPTSVRERLKSLVGTEDDIGHQPE
jgi:hypothetical protein